MRRPPRPGHIARCLLAVLALAVAAALAGCGEDDARGPLIGVQDDRLAEMREPAGERMEIVDGLGADVVRVDLRWDRVAGFGVPTRPRDPASPGYDWRRYDAVVEEASRRGVQVLFTIWGTPYWARDPSVPTVDRYGEWTARPRRAQDLGDFAAAAAARYAPKGVHLWEVWNEPNIPLFLRPQYERRNGRWRPASPRVYARMVRAMARGIRSVDPEARIGIGVTAPFGADLSQCKGREADCRIPPLVFLRELAAVAAAESTPLPMDAYSHHPYPLTLPREVSSETISSVDLYNIDRLESALRSVGFGDVPLWLSEFGFATAPVEEYRLWVPEHQQAEFLTDAVRRARANPRVEMFVWYFLQDSEDWASGLLRRDGTEKPAAGAFREAAGG